MTKINHVFLDMDRVLADFDEARIRLFGENPNGEEMWESIYNDHPDFFMDLKPMVDYKKLIQAVYSITDSVFILTALPKGRNMERACIQKQAWVRKYCAYGWEIPVITCLRKHKRDYAAPDALLIDDNYMNWYEFVDNGGNAIQHIDVEDTLNLLNKYM